jgi:hypothetical protein
MKRPTYNNSAKKIRKISNCVLTNGAAPLIRDLGQQRTLGAKQLEIRFRD